ncbi:MAG: excinuclease ABC subunit UvrC [Lentisphaeria bacterium]|nr:excinuclease ABC subunit UvrC [Lentisphaeria bacterium]
MTVSEYHPGEIPAKPGVYVFRDRFGNVIYVGKAVNLRRRLGNYFQPARSRNGDPKLRSLINSIADWNYEVVRSNDEALILESRLIKAYAPRYNILMRDDKRYLLLKLDMNEKFPTLRCARFKAGDNARYFGPFPHGTALKSTLEYLLARFKLRACKDENPDEESCKRCLKRIMKDCSAPCRGCVTEEEYGKLLESALEVLNGNIGELEAELEEKMRAFAAEQKFEQAARYREIISNLRTVFSRKNRAFENPELPGVPSGMAAVEALQERLKLAVPPRLIFGFDISNTFGTLAVSGMVVFRDGKPDRSSYRTFNIRSVEGIDDFSMIAEAVRRHFSRLLAAKGELCDLLLIDGGKGQLNAAVSVLYELNCPVIPVLGLAEKNEEIFLPGRSEPVILSRHDPALRLLQSVRDETHRYSITRHRRRREKLLASSVLENIPGIGDKRRQLLLQTFGSVAVLKILSAQQIYERCPELGEKLAGNIADFFSAGRS